MRRQFINQKWPLPIKLLLAPIGVVLMILVAPVILILMFADPDKAESITDFFIE